jgi:hypothetical protein
MAKGKGIESPELVAELLKRVLAEKSRRQAAGEPGPVPSAGKQSRKVKGEPTQAALEKLAAYLGVTVAWLRGDFITGHGSLEFNATVPAALCAKCGGELQTRSEELLQPLSDGGEPEDHGVLLIWPCQRCCKE